MSATLQETTATTVTSALNVRSVGKKLLMAITGFVAIGYVVGHMLGNLQIFLGQDQLNTYAEALHSMGPFLWVIRAFLLLAFAIHIWKGIQLKLENMASRPIAYHRKDYVEASLSSRTMVLSGLTVLAFVIYHLLHFTARITNPEYQNLVDPLGRMDVYSMVILGFQNYIISGFYIIAVGLLCFHLSHAIASMFQSVGWTKPSTLAILEKIGVALSVILFLGYISIPVAVLAGLVKLPGGGI